MRLPYAVDDWPSISKNAVFFILPRLFGSISRAWQFQYEKPNNGTLTFPADFSSEMSKDNGIAHPKRTRAVSYIHILADARKNEYSTIKTRQHNVLMYSIPFWRMHCPQKIHEKSWKTKNKIRKWIDARREFWAMHYRFVSRERERREEKKSLVNNENGTT